MTDIQDLVVRVGKPEDFPEVMMLAHAIAGENAPVEADREKLMTGIWQALNNENGLVGIVGPRGGPLQGFILLRIGTPWYSSQRIIEENGVYVHPDFRAQKGGRAAMLYRFAKQVADQMGTTLMIGVLSRHRTESKLRYYERYFGPQVGAVFLYNPLAALMSAPLAVAAE